MVIPKNKGGFLVFCKEKKKLKLRTLMKKESCKFVKIFTKKSDTKYREAAFFSHPFVMR